MIQKPGVGGMHEQQRTIQDTQPIQRGWWHVWIAPLLVLVGVVLITYGQWQWFEDIVAVEPGSVPVVIGLVLIVIALCPAMVMPAEVVLVNRTMRSDVDRPFGRWGIALIGVLVVAYTTWRAYPEDLRVWDILLLWSLGVGLTFFGLVPHEAGVAWRRKVTSSIRSEWPTWLLLCVLTVFGLIIRVAWLETSPSIMAGDEAQFAQEAAALKDHYDWRYNPFQLGIWHHPRLYHVLIGVAIDVVGQNVAAVRLPAAIFGALTIPAVYLMGRRMFGVWIGWIAALLMTTFPVQLQFSRTGMDMTGDPFFAALAFAFLIHALRENGLFEAALAGVTLGLSQYFYFAGRIAIVLIGVYVVLALLRDWRAMWRRIEVLAVAAVLVVVVAGPNVYAMWRDTSRSYSPRLKFVSIWETGELERARDEDRLVAYAENQLSRAFLAYVHFQDESDIYGRYSSVMGWYLGVPLMVGLAMLLRRWRDPNAMMLLAWMAGTALLGGVALIDPPHYPRYISATPALIVGAALGVAVIGAAVIQFGMAVIELAWQRRTVRYAVWRNLSVMSIALGLMGANFVSYTFDYMPQTHKILYGENTRQLNEVVNIFKSFEGKYTVLRFSSLQLDMNGTDLIRYLTPENAGVEYRGEIGDLEQVVSPGPYAFVFAPGRYDEVVPEFERLFPDGELRTYWYERADEPLIHVYYADVQE